MTIDQHDHERGMTNDVRSADSEESRAAATVLAAARARLAGRETGLPGFFDQLYADAVPADILRASPERLAALAEALHAEMIAHKPGEIRVALLDDPESHETLLAAVNDDRPFLFDSALLAAMAGGARIRAAFHPIIHLPTGRLSVIALICDEVGTEAARGALTRTVARAFAEGEAAVRDWRAMLARLEAARADLAARPPRGQDAREDPIREDVAFLDWLAADHFTFLGARDYVLAKDGAHGRLEPVAGSGLGVLAAQEARVIRAGSERTGLTAAVRDFLDEPEPLIITKSHARALVHRHAHMDYIGIKTYDAGGALTGERRFVGLFTSAAYSTQPRTIPLLRRKIAAAMARAGFAPASHDAKALLHILDTFPRDELFQISDAELYEIAIGILRLGGLPRLKLFLRFDRFDRFVSALLFAPRDHIDSAKNAAIHAMLAEALNGRTSAASVALEETALVRIHYIIGRDDGPLPPVDVRALERRIAAMLETWDDAFLLAMRARHPGSEAAARIAALDAHFPPGYRSRFSAHEAVRDLEVLEDLARADGLKLRASVWRAPGDAQAVLHLTLYVLGEMPPLSASLPVFDNLGLTAIAEDSFPVSFLRDGLRQDALVLAFLMERADGAPVRLDEIRGPLEDAFHAVMRGEAENDGFNRLVIAASLAWRQVVILRAVAKFLRQAGITYSLAYMQQALVANPGIAALLVELFCLRTDPAGRDAQRLGEVESGIEAALRDVPGLDEDRILRRFRNAIQAVLRTSFWQQERPYLALKLESGALDDLPAPRPWREIFVYAPQMEGVHLRFGAIARGGIRWSDRPEDFRTEILGLVKAQQVKNAVIVPVGAKGGFYPKTLPAGGAREDIQAVGVAAYKMLINAMLDLTDNLDAQGRVVPPPDMLRPDGDDPYLVVAADKGTASFSDIANAIALERGFWLGDAFASGGSAGYDHKKMGITARGAWEAVKRHFRELGTDIQKEDFTVIGVGDMSGDVFGNGMLLSKHIRLLAAFDHRHIFLDPNADAAGGFAERQRLFALPRSSWGDYNKEKIGKGGGVFARSLKEIPLSAEVKAMLDTDRDVLSPPALIQLLLKARTDLLWFGGIGTYIKASSQNQAEVGDRANDALRVDGNQIRARVVGEGANLGVTQAGRIEYARGGGRIDTDAVDNSAGVDTSDHEVNIKILLSGPVRRGELSGEKREAMLAAMTGEVAALVLADNYDQTLALSVAEHSAARDIDADARFMRDLESRGRLDRAVEFLPSEAAMRALAHEGKGLTRPELAVLLAYAKLDLEAEILASPLPDDPAFAGLLAAYFPPEAVKAFPDEPGRHRLRREIVSTMLANRIVNLGGPVFAFRMREMSGRSSAEVARGFVLADGAFGLSALKQAIDALDGKIPAALQNRLYAALAEQLRRVTPWFLAHIAPDAGLAEAIALIRAGTEALRGTLTPREEEKTLIAEFAAAGVPEALATDIVLLPRLAAAPDIALLARDGKAEAGRVAALYFDLGARLGLDRLRTLAAKLSPSEHWDRLALRRLLDDLSAAQRGVAAALLAESGAEPLEKWIEAKGPALARTRALLAALEESGELSIAKLMLASSQIQGLV
jgi:glutamate dehydrogenase